MDIRTRSTWEVTGDLKLTIGSHSRNPNGTNHIKLKLGERIVWDDDAPNGNVWFYFNYNGKKERGKIESGTIINLIKENRIKLIESGNSFVIYNNEYFSKIISQ